MTWNRFGRTKEKHGNRRGKCSLGHSHRSQLEISVCALLLLRQKAGELELLKAEDHLLLSDARIKYIADFKCLDVRTGETFWVEAKGFANDRWPIVKKLWAAYGPGALEIWQGTAARPVLTETIVPRTQAPGEGE
jgi:hypothetical protein